MNEFPNQALIPILDAVIVTLLHRYNFEQVESLLGSLSGGIGKQMTLEETEEMIAERCERFLKNPDCFK